ncbi:bifunctional phosphoribosyl-AMP cyclohydrolase/phosphoribosyl-ATP diphosphatase HisIE [Amphibacillus sp. MSJ-3]|uniref:bifunctional phosphoribosyl-AMP cyclohydrolase/phosphoribosyl-ATP diphosphatase HisIE n=1 Tax=Amphibacillus sp. MSJ-3 TaxID=2841505 RepID=UPI001C0ED8A7|nr:bifunctional phosphoribosyl-AMP cyclohydrolase/phosphoribosyl-ATP diphosphatase HisIE [Amphibacillus sp. MSJ-3]MBU5594166.1 bifunctional phosphoribosyl-AMP cyclohydrolase/phosphoribosyl-ATP diphosphatase HisIE [Amphibacillus sp. MSJ-3]
MKPDFSKGLVPAIIVDVKTKEVLMLAYMNEEAYQKTCSTGETWFYSRSRESLWHKGETSGHTQKVESISLDCDQDTLLIEVTPNGPACHTGMKSCFFNSIQANSSNHNYDEAIFEHVLKEINDRKQTRVEGSYTNYLFDKGIDKISKKVIEEAGEVVIAAKNNNHDELVLEICDLFYHTFVMMEQQDIALTDIKGELSKRFCKKANSKGDRSKIDKW